MKQDENLYRFDNSYDKRGLLYFLKRQIKWRLGDRSPILAYLKITDRCNLSCIYCPWHAPATKYDSIDTDTWKGLLLKIQNKGVRIVVIEGGEPTLRKDLDSILGYAKEIGLLTVLASNGSNIKLWDHNPTAFTISIDGIGEVHDATRGVGAFKMLERTLLAKENKTICSVTVVNKTNLNSLEEICQHFDKVCDGHLFTFMYPYNNLDINLNDHDIKHAKEVLLDMKKRYPILNPEKYLKKEFNQDECKPWMALSINHKGKFDSHCFVEHQEEPDCKACELSCYQLLSSLHNFSFEAWFNLNRILLKNL